MAGGSTDPKENQLHDQYQTGLLFAHLLGMGTMSE
jgi:hypothetical protein